MPSDSATETQTASIPENSLFLGFNRQSDSSAPVTLDPDTLLRHMMAIGSSGSGKTVVCKNLVEEFVRQGIPSICLDPQGDLCSLALAADDPEALREKGIDPQLAREFADKADVVVFTPASAKGVSLSVDPIPHDIEALSAHEQIHSITATATMLVSLLGYDLDSDDGEGLIAVFDRILSERLHSGTFPTSLDHFSQHLLAMDDEVKETYNRYLDSKRLEQALRRLARLDVGARRLMFHAGIPMNIELLLGLGEQAAPLPGKTRVSVIYLNSLHSQEDKEFFVAAIVEQLYNWMLRNPSSKPQALFYIDEIAPFIPPVRKPACKPGLSLLFKQARKYGVCCLTATQNPGDVDYKAMAQFGTWAIGRLTTRQDLKKVQPTIKSLDPVKVDDTMSTLPGLKPGSFVIISPDNFAESQAMQCRWLYSRHKTLDEEDIRQLTDQRWRQRFARKQTAEQPQPATTEPTPQHVAESAQQASEQEVPPATEKPAERKAADTETPRETTSPSAKGSSPQSEGTKKTNKASADFQKPLSDALNDALSTLAKQASMTTQEFSDAHSVSESQARTLLKKLLNEGVAERFKQGRSYVYWTPQSGFRPDLGLLEKINLLQPRLSELQAMLAAEQHARQKVLGFIGEEETVDSVHLEHRLCVKVSFRESVKQSLWRRITSLRSHEERLESAYLHPRTLQFITYESGSGIELHDRPGEHASDITDFDGATTLKQAVPAELQLDLEELESRPEDAVIKQRLEQAYALQIQQIDDVYLPIWRVLMRASDRAGHRVIYIDALDGMLFDW